MAKKHGKTYIREWRIASGMTLVQVAEQVQMTHGQLSRIERGLQPYNQELLENLSTLFDCEPVDLIVCDPHNVADIWSLWPKADANERSKIITIAEAMLGKGDSGNARQ